MNSLTKPGDIVIIDGKLKPADQLISIPQDADVVYEVIRLISGVPIFIEAHLERMNRSLHLAGFTHLLDTHMVKEAIHDLADECSISNQNIRLNLWMSGNRISWSGSLVESHYPDPSTYLKGIATGLLVMERDNPNAKVWQSDFKQAVSLACEKRNLYEMILVDSDGFISEGSRSNLFFTQGNVLLTAPDAVVLGGITRQKLIRLILEKKIPLVKRKIHVSELESFDGAFITGTSIHLLPVARIDAWVRSSSEQSLIKDLMVQFEWIVQEYISKYDIG